MKVVILCGGMGTRLREYTDSVPKPMVEIGGHPIVWHIMQMYAAAGMTEFVLCLGYLGHVIREYFLNYEANNRDFSVELGKPNSIQYHGDEEGPGFKVTLVRDGRCDVDGGPPRARREVSDAGRDIRGDLRRRRGRRSVEKRSWRSTGSTGSSRR